MTSSTNTTDEAIMAISVPRLATQGTKPIAMLEPILNPITQSPLAKTRLRGQWRECQSEYALELLSARLDLVDTYLRAVADGTRCDCLTNR